MQAGMKRTREQSACAEKCATIPQGKVNSTRSRPNLVRRASAASRTEASVISLPSPLPLIEAFGAEFTNTERDQDASLWPRRRKMAKTSKVKSESHAREMKVKVDEAHVNTTSRVMSRRSFAVVCSSNINRSMMAHGVLERRNMRAKSYGAGSQVKLPTKDPKSPKCFPFGTRYADIIKVLTKEDEGHYRRNSVLDLLERNAGIKLAPERWQDLPDAVVSSFDIVLCFEKRIFDLVLEDLRSRDDSGAFKVVHLLSMNIRDSASESAAASADVLELCQMGEGEGAATEGVDNEAQVVLVLRETDHGQIRSSVDLGHSITECLESLLKTLKS